MDFDKLFGEMLESQDMQELATKSAEMQAMAEAVFPTGDTQPCPDGENCPFHSRIDHHQMEDSEGYGLLVSYVGDYVVITGDNPALIHDLLEWMSHGKMPHKYTTQVLYVGDGTLAEVCGLEDDDEYNARIRHTVGFSDYSVMEATHNTTILGVKSGLIDLSE